MRFDNPAFAEDFDLAPGGKGALAFDLPEDRFDVDAPVREMPRRAEAGPTLVATAREDDDPLAPPPTPQHGKSKRGHRAAGVLHDLKDVEAVVFLSDPLDLFHLGCGDRGDLSDPALREATRVGAQGHGQRGPWQV